MNINVGLEFVRESGIPSDATSSGRCRTFYRVLFKGSYEDINDSLTLRLLPFHVELLYEK